MTNYETIEAVFREQGGTGYEGLMHYDGCRCALGALTKMDRTDLGIMAAEGYSGVDLYVAHDEALLWASKMEMEGLYYDEEQEVHRALYGTEAYNHVMDAIKEALS